MALKTCIGCGIKFEKGLTRNLCKDCFYQEFVNECKRLLGEKPNFDADGLMRIIEKKKQAKRQKYRKNSFLHFSIGGIRSSVYTNGATQEMKMLFPKLLNDVLEDCIKNPARYLENATKLPKRRKKVKE